ncbi:MAG: hypothetical protein DMG09_28985 [Acidobacteria bacterium]|nr:MAG: hypothetical protein DMG09_28985 [Acidobacteriota bacterium]
MSIFLGEAWSIEGRKQAQFFETADERRWTRMLAAFICVNRRASAVPYPGRRGWLIVGEV